jgi:glutamine cyclotransferase
MKKSLSILLLCTIIISCSETQNQGGVIKNTNPIPVKNIQFKLIAEYPHDTSLFTEGLLVNQGKIFESTGSPSELPDAESMIGFSDLKTGKFQMKQKLD